MNELGYQKFVIQQVFAAGGFAWKSNNRFLIGVADLMVKLPGYPCCALEVKKNKMPVKKDSVVLDVTPLQTLFLRNCAMAGMPAGVLSFLTTSKRKTDKSLVIPITSFPSDQMKDFEVGLVRSSSAKDHFYGHYNIHNEPGHLTVIEQIERFCRDF